MRQLMSGEAALAGAGSVNAKAQARPANAMSDLDFMVAPPVGGPRPSVHSAAERRGKTLFLLQPTVQEVDTT
jgi:hypothetical protein